MYSEDTNQSAHLHSLISLSFWNEETLNLATHRAHIEDSDQTAQMCRLMWDFNGRPCQLVTLLYTNSYLCEIMVCLVLIYSHSTTPLLKFNTLFFVQSSHYNLHFNHSIWLNAFIKPEL